MVPEVAAHPERIQQAKVIKSGFIDSPAAGDSPQIAAA